MQTQKIFFRFIFAIVLKFCNISETKKSGILFPKNRTTYKYTYICTNKSYQLLSFKTTGIKLSSAEIFSEVRSVPKTRHSKHL